MPKVMMPMTIATQSHANLKWWSSRVTCGNTVVRKLEGNSKAEALAAAKEWVLENGGTWEEDNG